MRLLLLSNSTNYGESYFNHALNPVKEFLGTEIKQVIFIPYAAVDFSYDEYENKLNESWASLGIQAVGIHKYADPLQAIKEAEAFAIGGGNTFQLLKLLYHYNLLPAIVEKVKQGIPYIGWSAGSNVTCPTIQTTNDMPVAEPPSFKALNLVPFQINPHYTEETIPNHGGESRPQRIKEYITVNPDIYVVGLPEGTILRIENEDIQLIGNLPIKVFRKAEKDKTLQKEDFLNFLWK